MSVKLRFHAAPAPEHLRAGVRFADYERPAVNGVSLSMFVYVYAPHARPVVDAIRLHVGAQCLAIVTTLSDDHHSLASLCPGHEQHALYAHMSVNRLLLRRRDRIQLVVSGPGGEHGLGTIEIDDNRTELAVPPVAMTLRPILVTSLGRSGSTVLVNGLGLHPQVKSVGGYPFEYRFFSYCLHAANVLMSPANHDTSMGGDAFEQRHPYHVGFNPFNHRGYDRLLADDALRRFYETRFARRAARLLVGSADEALALVAPEKTGAVAFVEKVAGTHLATLARNLCAGTREIVLTRNFWDMVSSMVAFDRKRGSPSFVANGAWWLVGMARQHTELLRRARGDDTLHVRYETLLADPRSTMARLLHRLGLDASDPVVDTVLQPLRSGELRGVHSTQRIDQHELRATFDAAAVRAADVLLAESAATEAPLDGD